MTDNDIKTPTDKPITVRIPLDLLEAIENLASDRYPSRKGTGGNRSQVILDALVFYQSRQWGEGESSLQSTQSNVNGEAIEETVKKFLYDNVNNVIQETFHDKLQSITNNLEYMIDKAVDKRIQSTQSHINETSLQSVQKNTVGDNSSLQSTQDITDNNSSEDSLKSSSNDNHDTNIIEEDKPVIEVKSEDIPESEETKTAETTTQTRIEDKKSQSTKLQKRTRLTKDELDHAIEVKDLEALLDLPLTEKLGKRKVVSHLKEKCDWVNTKLGDIKLNKLNTATADEIIREYCQR